MIYNGVELQAKLERLKNAFKKHMEDYGNDYTQYDKDLVEFFYKEMDNPAPVEEGKYKIPHKFLYDQITNVDTTNFYEIINVIADYRTYDGTLSKESGEQLEMLYTDNANYLFLHNVNYKGDHPSEEEQVQICESICRNGLRLTTMGNEVGKIDYTTIGSKDSIGMIALMSNWSLETGIVVLQIPKEKIDNMQQVIGSDTNAPLSPENPGAILPEFVVGYLSNAEFVNNPISMAIRQGRYPNKFSEIPRLDEYEMI